jgi:tRNA (adenine57-N1/adenine58-N1)-methyltransferase
LEHDRLIGAEPGSTHRTTKGLTFTVFRPTLSDLVFKMPRGAQVIYPKDLGPILMLADIAPGVEVLESGVGSGALSSAMLRAGAVVTGYELREDFARRAQLNVARAVGTEVAARYTVELRDVYDGIEVPESGGFDRVVLDLPEPWQVVPHLRGALRPGGIVLAYTPSIIQASRFREALAEADLVLAETLEVLHRTWKVDGAAVRPDHRMVAHTAFLSHARMPSAAARTLPPDPADTE